jgi:hypothetical protein
VLRHRETGQEVKSALTHDLEFVWRFTNEYQVIHIGDCTEPYVAFGRVRVDEGEILLQLSK